MMEEGVQMAKEMVGCTVAGVAAEARKQAVLEVALAMELKVVARGDWGLAAEVGQAVAARVAVVLVAVLMVADAMVKSTVAAVVEAATGAVVEAATGAVVEAATKANMGREKAAVVGTDKVAQPVEAKVRVVMDLVPAVGAGMAMEAVAMEADSEVVGTASEAMAGGALAEAAAVGGARVVEVEAAHPTARRTDDRVMEPMAKASLATGRVAKETRVRVAAALVAR